MTTPVIARRWLVSEAVARTGATYRQIDYWLRCGWLGPDNAHGSGSQRTLTRQQLRRIQILATASAIGISPRHIAPHLGDVDNMPDDITVVHLPVVDRVGITVRIDPIP